MRSLGRLAVVVALSLAATSARAVEIQKEGAEQFPSKHELSAHLGYQAGFGGVYQNPSGLKLTAEYAYRFQQLAWFDVQLSNVFGFGSNSGPCADTIDINTLCYRGGWAFGVAGGVKLKWVTPVPLVIETPILVGVDILYNRDCGDNGAAAPLLRTGFGAKYFLTKKIGLGAGIDFSFAPGFHGGSNVLSCKRSSYTDFYGAFVFQVGAEFLL